VYVRIDRGAETTIAANSYYMLSYTILNEEQERRGKDLTNLPFKHYFKFSTSKAN